MSHSNYTKNILNIKDENITFEENCLELVKIKEITTKVFHGKLTYSLAFCPNCGCIYESNHETIIKYDFKKNFKVKVDKACGYRRFNHLKASVMLIKGLLSPIKEN